MNPEMSVQLRLKMDKAQADAKSAASVVQKEMEAMLSHLGKFEFPSEKKSRLARIAQLKQEEKEQAAIDMRQFAREDAEKARQAKAEERRKQTEALNRKREADKLAKDAEKQQMAATKLNIWMRKNGIKEELRLEKEKLSFYKDMSLLALPLLKPGSIWGNLFASRGIATGLLGTEKGRNFMGAFGVKGAAGATAVTSGLMIGAATVGTALLGLKKAAEGAAIAFEDARKIYAKSLTSGLSIGFIQKRTALANILGVSETEVIRFGRAMEYLNPKIEWANGILSATNRRLTATGWNFKILQYDLQAMFASIADRAKPSIDKLTDALDAMIKKATEWGGKGADFVNDLTSSISKVAEMQKASLWAEQYGANVDRIDDPNRPGAIKGYQFTTAVGTPFNEKMQEKLKAMFKKQMGIKESGALKEAPSPVSYMKQLGASSLERMGLVMGGGTNPVQETAKNTKATADGIKHLIRIMSPKNSMNPFPLSQSYL